MQVRGGGLSVLFVTKKLVSVPVCSQLRRALCAGISVLFVTVNVVAVHVSPQLGRALHSGERLWLSAVSLVCHSGGDGCAYQLPAGACTVCR